MQGRMTMLLLARQFQHRGHVPVPVPSLHGLGAVLLSLGGVRSTAPRISPGRALWLTWHCWSR